MFLYLRISKKHGGFVQSSRAIMFESPNEYSRHSNGSPAVATHEPSWTPPERTSTIAVVSSKDEHERSVLPEMMQLDA